MFSVLKQANFIPEQNETYRNKTNKIFVLDPLFFIMLSGKSLIISKCQVTISKLSENS